METGKVAAVAAVIKEIIAEHNKIWGDISSHGSCGHPGYPKGYHCFTVKEDVVWVIAAGLIRKGLIHEPTQPLMT